MSGDVRTAAELFLGSGQFREDAEVFERGGVAGDVSTAGNLLEKTPHDFSAPRFGQRFGKTNFVRLGD